MSEAIALTAEIRDQLGTGPARALRKKGMVPATIYGNGNSPMSVAVEEKEITKLYRKPQFISALIELNVGGKKYKVLPKAVQLHPITDIVRHVDFVFLDDKFQKMEVPISFEGKDKSLGIKRGGFFNIVKRSAVLKCPVKDLPRKIVVDVSNMLIGHSIKANDITLPQGCEFINKSNFVVATIIGKAGRAEAAEEAPANKA